ncbi:hypothetical protein AB205_0151920 [Aquarana catesbeiana]|uniref:Uncharacterized protein n=1 Tax=Aquarana catesbeiana TaxID=8400 RepID=A0A2G9RZ25_AQUCT|nr:hypothetical protein AB205_0151920 [Aquarana catesbeiana]
MLGFRCAPIPPPSVCGDTLSDVLRGISTALWVVRRTGKAVSLKPQESSSVQSGCPFLAFFPDSVRRIRKIYKKHTVNEKNIKKCVATFLLPSFFFVIRK